MANKYSVNCLLPKAKNGNDVINFFMTYAFKAKGIPVNGSMANSITDSLQRKLFGGVPVSGKLVIDDLYMEFTPGFLSNITMSNIESFRIPLSDIISATPSHILLISPAVIVTTINGEIKFQLLKATHWYNPFVFPAKEICRLLTRG